MVELGFCAKTAEIWLLVGNIVNIIKIVIPILIIVLACIDFGKAVVSSDEKEIKKSSGTLIKRVIAGVVIFFIPTIVGLCFGLVGSFSDNEADYNICKTCVTSPSKCDTSSALEPSNAADSTPSAGDATTPSIN